jgi:hypothetical protein
MTSMLYTACIMNNKSIFPESVQPVKHCSFLADMKLNAWAIVAVLMAIGSRILLHQNHEWGVSLRAVAALSPLLPSLLYVWSVARWIRGMDELQRRIQLEACLFATIGTIFITTALSLLADVGGINMPRLQHGLGWEGAFASVMFLYILGNIIVNRRYK